MTSRNSSVREGEHKQTLAFEEVMGEIITEKMALDRAGTLTDAKRQALDARLADVLKKDNEALLSNPQMRDARIREAREALRRSASPDLVRVALFAMAWLSPSLAAIAAILLGPIAPWHDGMVPLPFQVLAVLQVVFLFGGLRPIRIRPRSTKRMSAEIERRRHEVEALFVEGQRAERKILFFCSAVVFVVLLAVVIWN